MDHANGDAVARPSGAVRQVVDGVSAISAVGRRRPLAGAAHRRHSAEGVDAVVEIALAEGVDLIDSTIVKAHPHAAGATTRAMNSLGRSRGGFTTKLHAVVDSTGALVRFALGGQVNDITQAADLVCRRREADAVVGDRAYDSDASWRTRRVSTRYDKTAVSYASVVAVAATVVSLTGWRA